MHGAHGESETSASLLTSCRQEGRAWRRLVRDIQAEMAEDTRGQPWRDCKAGVVKGDLISVIINSASFANCSCCSEAGGSDWLRVRTGGQLGSDSSHRAKMWQDWHVSAEAARPSAMRSGCRNTSASWRKITCTP